MHRRIPIGPIPRGVLETERKARPPINMHGGGVAETTHPPTHPAAAIKNIATPHSANADDSFSARGAFSIRRGCRGRVWAASGGWLGGGGRLGGGLSIAGCFRRTLRGHSRRIAARNLSDAFSKLSVRRMMVVRVWNVGDFDGTNVEIRWTLCRRVNHWKFRWILALLCSGYMYNIYDDEFIIFIWKLCNVCWFDILRYYSEIKTWYCSKFSDDRCLYETLFQ